MQSFLTRTSFLIGWLSILFATFLLAGKPSAQAQALIDENDPRRVPKGIFWCGEHPVFEYFDDSNGEFIYRKVMTKWVQGHENVTRSIQLKATKVGGQCHLDVRIGNLTRKFRFNACDKKDCPRLTTIQDVTRSSKPANDASLKCNVSGAHSPELIRCQNLKPKTVKHSPQAPAECRSTGTGVLVEPYTCKYISRPVLHSASALGARFCNGKSPDKICTAKVLCEWNGALKREDQVINYETVVYCPAHAGRCPGDAMSCGANRDVYFAQPARVRERIFQIHSLPGSEQRSAQ